LPSDAHLVYIQLKFDDSFSLLDFKNQMSHSNVTKEMSGVDVNAEGKPYHRKKSVVFWLIMRCVLI
jgi:hypothetical protein